MINCNKIENDNETQIIINRPRRSHAYKYAKYQNIPCLGKIMFICNKQNINSLTIQAQFINNLSNTEAELKKCVAYKKKPVI